MSFNPIIRTQDVTVASGQTTSAEIDLVGTQLVGIYTPSTFDGTTITLTASPTAGGTFVAVQDGNGNAFTITTTASRFAPVNNLAITAGLRYIKLVCGTSQSTTDTVLTIATRPV